MLEERIAERYSNGNPKVLEKLSNQKVIFRREYHSNNIRKREGPLLKGQFHGPVQEWSSNGALWAEGDYKSGLLDGDWVYWYNKDVIRQKGSYSKGQKNGLWLLYYKTGILKKKQIFKDGNLQGKEEGFFPSGSLQYSNSCHQQDGWKQQFSSKSQLLVKESCSFNRSNGLYQRWDVLGSLLENGNFVLGHKIGSWEYYFAAGGLRKLESWDKGLRHGVWWEISKQQDTLYRTNFFKGTGRLQTLCTQKISICVDSNFVSNQVHGKIISIKKDSHKIIDYFKQGEKYQSVDFAWFKNSWLKIKNTPFIGANIHGTQKRWDSRGTLRESVQYQHGEKLGDHLLFDKKGFLIQSRTHLGKDMGLLINPI